MRFLTLSRYCENGSLHSICKNFGKFPENLEPPPPLPPFPANPDDAVDVAVDNNPALETARQQ